VPTLEDAAQLLRVLCASATGQDARSIRRLSTGPRRPGDPTAEGLSCRNSRQWPSTMLAASSRICCAATLRRCITIARSTRRRRPCRLGLSGTMARCMTPLLIGVAEAASCRTARLSGAAAKRCASGFRLWHDATLAERNSSPPVAAPMRYVWDAGVLSQPAGAYEWRRVSRARPDLAAEIRRCRFAAVCGGWDAYRDLAAAQGATFQARRADGAVDELPTRRLRQHSPRLAYRRKRRAVRRRYGLKQAPPGIVPKRGRGVRPARNLQARLSAPRRALGIREWRTAGKSPRFLRRIAGPAARSHGRCFGEETGYFPGASAHSRTSLTARWAAQPRLEGASRAERPRPRFGDPRRRRLRRISTSTGASLRRRSRKAGVDAQRPPRRITARSALHWLWTCALRPARSRIGSTAANGSEAKRPFSPASMQDARVDPSPFDTPRRLAKKPQNPKRSASRPAQAAARIPAPANVASFSQAESDGHTSSRPQKFEAFGNWRLATPNQRGVSTAPIVPDKPAIGMAATAW